MNRTTNRIAIACVLVAGTAGMAAAQAESFYDNARVRSVEPQYEQFSVPREQCTTQYVTEQRPVQGSRTSNGTSIGGAIIGGVAGGILGNQVGKGSGRDAATAVGAAVGALAGNSIGANNARPVQYETVQRPVQQCQTVQEVQQRINGYQVAYDYRGQTYHTVLANDPGPNIRVRVSVDPVVN